MLLAIVIVAAVAAIIVAARNANPSSRTRRGGMKPGPAESGSAAAGCARSMAYPARRPSAARNRPQERSALDGLSARADVVTEVTQQNGTDTETDFANVSVGRIASPPSHRHRGRACGGWTSLPLSLSSRGLHGAA